MERLSKYINVKPREFGIGLLLIFGGIFAIYNIVYADKILPRVYVGTISVGGLTREEAEDKIKSYFDILEAEGIRLSIDGNTELIKPRDIDLRIPFRELAQGALRDGRRGGMLEQFRGWITAPVSTRVISGSAEVDREKLKSEIAILADIYDVPRKDIRFGVNRGQVEILYDTKPGKILNRAKTESKILAKLSSIDFSELHIELDDDLPRANPLSAEESKAEAERIIQEDIKLTYKGFWFKVTQGRLDSWITSEYEGDRLVPGLNKKSISEYITEIAEDIDTLPQEPQIVIKDGKVVDFTPPRYGRALLQDETIELLLGILEGRRLGNETVKELSLPVSVKKPQNEEVSELLGIVELIGSATTPFTGSPKNRIHNIKNGVKFLSGILIPPGEEFSTVGALGDIDNTTGYLPELVIKGDETIPEFGGGLCQVSTTLFRSVLSAGLPVLERRNHSYRVPYYEYDGDRNFIGPGLDATIYLPKPDFRFKNDTEKTILIYGYIEGDEITFEFYGTSDGRVAEIDGPHTLSEVSPPDPIYKETDTLPPGEIKRIDTAHPGGEAIATYTVTYPDGEVKTQEFKSYYRKWPAKYLIGAEIEEGEEGREETISQ